MHIEDIAIIGMKDLLRNSMNDVANIDEDDLVRALRYRGRKGRNNEDPTARDVNIDYLEACLTLADHYLDIRHIQEAESYFVEARRAHLQLVTGIMTSAFENSSLESAKDDVNRINTRYSPIFDDIGVNILFVKKQKLSIGIDIDDDSIFSPYNSAPTLW